LNFWSIKHPLHQEFIDPKIRGTQKFNPKRNNKRLGDKLILPSKMKFFALHTNLFSILLVIHMYTNNAFVPNLRCSTKHFSYSKHKNDNRKLKMSSKSSNSMNFDEMKSFETRLQRIEKSASECIEIFYEPHLRSFSVFPGLSDVSSSMDMINASPKGLGIYFCRKILIAHFSFLSCLCSSVFQSQVHALHYKLFFYREIVQFMIQLWITIWNQESPPN